MTVRLGYSSASGEVTYGQSYSRVVKYKAVKYLLDHEDGCKPVAAPATTLPPDRSP